jgi:hypothetical protein
MPPISLEIIAVVDNTDVGPDVVDALRYAGFEMKKAPPRYFFNGVHPQQQHLVAHIELNTSDEASSMEKRVLKYFGKQSEASLEFSGFYENGNLVEVA